MTRTHAPLKVVIIGYGRMGRRHAEVYRKSPNFSLVAICGRDKQRAEIESNFDDVAFYTDLDGAIVSDPPDLVCICTHIDSHDSLTRLALDNGCHVFLEKPVTTTVAESRALFEYARQKGRKLIVGHILHHDQLWVNFIGACRELSHPIEIEIQLDQHSSGEEWEIHKKILENSTIASDCAIHFFDIMAQAVNSEIDTVTASSACTHRVDSINDNYLFATIEFADGSTGTYKSGWGPGFESPNVKKIIAAGQDESILIEESDDKVRIIKIHADGTQENIYSERMHLENATRSQQDFVCQAINEDRSLQHHHQRTLACMQVAEAADQSITEAKPVMLNSRS